MIFSFSTFSETSSSCEKRISRPQQRSREFFSSWFTNRGLILQRDADLTLLPTIEERIRVISAEGRVEGKSSKTPWKRTTHRVPPNTHPLGIRLYSGRTSCQIRMFMMTITACRMITRQILMKRVGVALLRWQNIFIYQFSSRTILL